LMLSVGERQTGVLRHRYKGPDEQEQKYAQLVPKRAFRRGNRIAFGDSGYSGQRKGNMLRVHGSVVLRGRN